MPDLSHAETGDRDHDRVGIRAIAGVEELFLPDRSYKWLDGQRQFERNCLGRLTEGIAALLKAEFARQSDTPGFERKFEQQVKEDSYLRMERAYGSFSRSFSLPNTVNAEAIQADYKNGVLTVTLPKRAESRPKQVKINVTNGKN